MTAVEVRPADDSDVEAMAAIYVNAARAGWAHIFDEPSLKAIEPPVDRLRAELASTDSRQQLLVAERQGRVIGFAVVRPSRDEDAGVRVGELDQFYCDPPAWGQGVGRQLMAAAIASLVAVSLPDSAWALVFVPIWVLLAKVLSTLGYAVVIMQAIAVGVLAELEIIGLRRADPVLASA